MSGNENQVLPRKGHLKVRRAYCTGCGLCELACTLFHEGVCQPAIARMNVRKDFLELRFVPQVCAQCRDPACYRACPVSAVRVDERTGARFIDEQRCTGCGSCAEACPLMPHSEVLRQVLRDGKKVYVKCDLCKDRQLGPLCVQFCPRDALQYTGQEGA
jgi:carbon-monoxide dehydrogenase iron sulfur subunit